MLNLLKNFFKNIASKFQQMSGSIMNNKQSYIFDCISLIVMLFFLLGYLLFRVMNDPLRVLVMADLNITSSMFASLVSIFSLGYGLTQTFTGILLEKFGMAILPLYALIIGVLTILTGTVKSYYILLIIRLLLGAFCSGGMVGYIFYTNQVWKKYISLVLNIGVSIAYFIASFIVGYAETTCLQTYRYDTLLKYFGVGFIITSVFMFFSLKPFILDNNIENKTQENNNSLLSYFNTEMFIFCLLSVLPMFHFYGFIDGNARPLVQLLSNNTISIFGYNLFTFSAVNITSLYTQSLSILLLVSAVILQFISAKIFNVVLISLNVLFVTLYSFYSSNPILLLLAIIFSSAGFMVHSCIQTYVSQRDTYGVATKVAILNTCAMMIGASGAQKLTGILSDILLARGFIASNISLIIMRIYLIPASLTLVLCLYILFRKENK